MSNTKLNVNELEIVLYKQNEEEYISLTDMAKFRDTERTNYIIQNWMRTRSTIEFLGLWEQLRNPNFKSIEFDAFRNESGSNSFTITPKRWIEATDVILETYALLRDEKAKEIFNNSYANLTVDEQKKINEIYPTRTKE